jgi:ribulose-5-phosphate 4-epimerase/fuculose-1-phosphate aldolase
MLLEPLRREILTTVQKLIEYGLVWMAGGTACARDPETGYVVVTPSGMAYEGLSPEDIIVTDLDGDIVDGQHRPSVALKLWTGILRARQEVNAVVHTHSPYATAFSLVNQPIPVATETMADWFGQPVPVTPYLSVEDPDFATIPISVLGSGFAVLLGKHGVITIGANLAHALERAVTLEEAARTHAIARILGVPVSLTEAQARDSFDYYHHRYGQPKKPGGG